MKRSLSDVTVDPSRIRTLRAPPRSWKNIPIVQPKTVLTDGLKWIAIRTVPKYERFVADNLPALGYNTYCPLGAKFVFWQDGKRSKHRLTKQFPVFFGYVFVGLRKGQGFSKYLLQGSAMIIASRILSIIGDSQGPLIIPAAAIAEISARELDFQWDETRRSPFRLEAEVRILNGPFRDFRATVDEVTSEGRIRALVTIFGRQTPLTLDVDDVETV